MLDNAPLAVHPQMSSQGDDDSPHDAAAQRTRSGAFTIAAHDGNGWPASSALRSASSPAPEADVDRGDGSLLRPVMRTLPSALVGGRGHYADRSTAQPDQPEELLQVIYVQPSHVPRLVHVQTLTLAIVLASWPATCSWAAGGVRHLSPMPRVCESLPSLLWCCMLAGPHHLAPAIWQQP